MSESAAQAARRMIMVTYDKIGEAEMGEEELQSAEKSYSATGSIWSARKSFRSTDEADSAIGSLWSNFQRPTSTTNLNSKGHYVTAINHRQQNPATEPSSTYMSASTYGKKA